MENNTNEIYHSDHLGSSSYITDNFGRPSHYYEYLPFGELMTEHNQSKYYIDPYPTQNMDSYNNPYKFNDFGGKSERALPERTARSAEMDRETGMYYYGARYYDPRISIFVSVDPLAEEFPNYGGYVYTMNNPINLIDPTGMAPEDIIIWGWNPVINRYAKSVVIKSDIYKIDYYSKNIMAPLAPVSRAPGQPTTIYGLDVWAKLFGKPDAIRISASAEMHTGSVNVGGTMSVVAPLQGQDKGGIFFYSPSNEQGFDIGLERDSRTIQLSGTLGASLIYDSDKNYSDFNRYKFEGLEYSVDVGVGVLNVEGFKSSDDSYYGVGLSVGKSFNLTDGKRKPGGIKLSGSKLINELSIEPGKKDEK